MVLIIFVYFPFVFCIFYLYFLFFIFLVMCWYHENYIRECTCTRVHLSTFISCPTYPNMISFVTFVCCLFLILKCLPICICLPDYRLICLSVCLSLYLYAYSIGLSIYLFVYVPLFLPFSFFLSFCFLICLPLLLAVAGCHIRLSCGWNLNSKFRKGAQKKTIFLSRNSVICRYLVFLWRWLKEGV